MGILITSLALSSLFLICGVVKLIRVKSKRNVYKLLIKHSGKVVDKVGINK